MLELIQNTENAEPANPPSCQNVHRSTRRRVLRVSPFGRNAQSWSVPVAVGAVEVCVVFEVKRPPGINTSTKMRTVPGDVVGGFRRNYMPIIRVWLVRL